MKWIFCKMVKHKKIVVTFYIIAAIFSIIMVKFVKVNSDLTDYLPKDSDSTIALHIMDEEFDSEIPNATLMVKDIELNDAAKLEDKLKDIDGVNDVSWATDDNTFDLPLEMLPPSTLEKYYKDNNALYTLTLDEDKRIDLIDEIREVSGKEIAVSGGFVNSKVSQATSGSEILKTVAIVILLAILLLMATLDSWLEPILLMLCLGVGVVLNSGTNIILGTVSSVTNTAASVLQMGVSIDYFIFLLHRYKEYKERGYKPEDAMIQAMLSSGSSIVSSSLTTIIGFLALVFMRYRIGLDMGIVLSKGVGISLICAFTFLPCLILTFDKLTSKTRHKILIEGAGAIPNIVLKLRIPAFIFFVVVLFPALNMQAKNQYYYGDSHSYKDSHYVAQERKEIADVFGESNTMVLLVPKGNIAKENMLADELSEIPELKSVTSYSETLGVSIPMDMVPDSLKEKLVSDEYSRSVLSFSLDVESEKTFNMIDKIKQITEKYYGNDFHLVGSSVSTYDLKKVISADNTKVNSIAVGAIFIILLISFKSVLIPCILTLLIEGSIWISMAIPYVTGNHLFYIGYLIVSSILLGSTVDYAILVMSRYLEHRVVKGLKESIHDSIASSTISIFTSGSILTIAGVLLNHFCTSQLTAQLGILLARGTVIAILVVLFVLPAMITVFDKVIIRKKVK